MRIDMLVYEPAHLELPIQFSAETGTFSCAFGGAFFEEAMIEVLKQKVLSAIEGLYQLEWKPVLLLRIRVWEQTNAVEGDSYTSTALHLVRERRYIAHHPELGYLQANWERSPEARIKGSTVFSWDGPFVPPTHKKSPDGTTFYFPYTEPLWEGVTDIQRCVQKTAVALSKHLRREEGVHVLRECCERLLASPLTPDSEEWREGSSQQKMTWRGNERQPVAN